MSDDPIDDLAAFWAQIGERTQQYLEVWMTAAARNAKGDYVASDLMVDLETVWGMGVADAALLATKAIENAASFAPGPPPTDVTPPDDAGSGGE